MCAAYVSVFQSGSSSECRDGAQPGRIYRLGEEVGGSWAWSSPPDEDPGCHQKRGDHLSVQEKTLFFFPDCDSYTMRRSRCCGENGATCESPPQTQRTTMPLTHYDAADLCRDSPRDGRLKKIKIKKPSLMGLEPRKKKINHLCFKAAHGGGGSAVAAPFAQSRCALFTDRCGEPATLPAPTTSPHMTINVLPTHLSFFSPSASGCHTNTRRRFPSSLQVARLPTQSACVSSLAPFRAENIRPRVGCTDRAT